MAQNHQSGKLAVILHADVAGSTALVQKDERLAHERIRDTFRRFSACIGKYQGRVRELRGDALLAEFERASDAVTATLAFQAEHEQYIAQLNDEIRPEVRTGIAMGEVIIADSTVTGAGVVLAQRVEQLASAGGLCITAAIHEALPQRMPFDQKNLGEQQVKGFDEQIRVYAVTLIPGAALPDPESSPRAVAGVPEPPDKPSIAVLPFTNMSGDPEQEYFSDGITENIITNLSRFRDFVVIARQSSFAYKGKAVKIQEVSRELGVGYVLEGSVQRSSDHVRITAQLIDGDTGGHVWSEKYDRHMDDIFVVQDEVTEIIVGTVASGYGGRLRKAWQRHARGSKTQNIQAFDCFMRGLDFTDHFTEEDTQRAREYFREAIRLDPNYAKAYAKLAWGHILDAYQGWGNDYEGSLAKGQEYANQAIECEDEESWGHWALGGYYMFTRQHDRALSEFRRAVELNPNDADVLNDYGLCLGYTGRFEEGLESVRKSMRLNPHYPEWYLLPLGQMYFDTNQYEEAVAAFGRLRSLETTISCLYLAASHAALNQSAEADDAVARALELDPSATLERWTNVKLAPYSDANDLEHFREYLRKTGLPD